MMGKESPRHRCRWVCERLPLLDGGELIGADRRKVESHLLACAACRSRRAGLSGALGALRAAAAEPPPGLAPEAPSLWPSLRRQIREGRHEPRRPSLPFGFTPWPSLPEAASWLQAPAARLAGLAAGGLVAAWLASAGVGAWARSQVSAANALTAAAALPIAPGPMTAPRHSALDFGPSVATADADAATTVPDRTPASRLGYDLDRGTPMTNPDAGQTKPSY